MNTGSEDSEGDDQFRFFEQKAPSKKEEKNIIENYRGCVIWRSRWVKKTQGCYSKTGEAYVSGSELKSK